MLKHQHLVAAPRMLPCCLAATNPAAQMEKLLFFFCASSLTSRDGAPGSSLRGLLNSGSECSPWPLLALL